MIDEWSITTPPQTTKRRGGRQENSTTKTVTLPPGTPCPATDPNIMMSLCFCICLLSLSLSYLVSTVPLSSTLAFAALPLSPARFFFIVLCFSFHFSLCDSFFLPLCSFSHVLVHRSVSLFSCKFNRFPTGFLTIFLTLMLHARLFEQWIYPQY